MTGYCNHVKICCVASVVPSRIEDNEKYVAECSNRRAKKHIKLTGIKRRRICFDGQTASDLGAIAASKVIDSLGWKKEDIDVLIYVTQSSDLHRPASAFLIQNRLGLSHDCMMFDINQGCAGYVIGLSTIIGILSTTHGKGILIVGESAADPSNIDYPNTMLNGDAASATALEYIEDNNSEMIFSHYGDGSRAPLLFCRNDGYAFMDGNAILLFGLNDVARSVRQFMKEQNIDDEDVDYFVFHQAQKMIVEGVINEISLPADKVLMSCEEYGNTSSASIPLTLCHCLARRDLKGVKNVLVCGFGIGLTWSIGYIKLNPEDLMPVIETDYKYNDMSAFAEKK